MALQHSQLHVCLEQEGVARGVVVHHGQQVVTVDVAPASGEKPFRLFIVYRVVRLVA